MGLNTRALLISIGIGAAGAFVLALLAQIPVVGIVCCCLVYLGYAGVGVLYGVFHRQSGMPPSAGIGALGGAIAAAIASLGQSIVNIVVTLIAGSAGAFSSYVTQMEQMGYEVPPEVAQFYASSGSAVLISLVGLCLAFFIAAILGAIGGAIYGATQSGSTVRPM